MSTNATDPEVAQPGLQVQEGNMATNRKKGAFRDRKLSVLDPNAHSLDGDDLSEADRRLAEMGYVQVSLIDLSQAQWS